MPETNADKLISDLSEEQPRYADFKSAYRSVPSDEKRRALAMLIAAGVTLAVLFLSRLLWLLKPLFELMLVYYGVLAPTVYYVLVGIVFTVYVVLLNRFLKKHCAVRLLTPRQPHMDVPRTLAVIAVGAVTVLCIGAAFEFKVKIQIEMGTGITMLGAISNFTVYLYYGLHLWLGLIAASLIQRALSVLIPTRHSVPWGAIALVTVFGLVELLLEVYTTAHMYPLLYYILTYVYAAVYELTDRSFHLTFWACIVILVL